MNDMSQVIIPRSDQINADTLLAGPMTVTIKEVQISGGQEQPVSIFLEQTPLAFRPCKSMSRVLVHAWGPDAKVYVGRSLTLYRDPSVKWGGLEVGGIRISHMSNIDSKLQMQLTSTKGQRKPHVVMPLVIGAAANGNGRAKAETWVAEYLKAPTEGPTSTKILAKLKAEYPDLYAQVTAAQQAGDDPFAQDQPATGASPAEADFPHTEGDVAALSEQATLAAAKAEIAACELAIDLGGILTRHDGSLSEDDHAELRAYALARDGVLKGE